MSQAIKRSDVMIRVDDNREIIVSFKNFPYAKINTLGRINGKSYDFQKVGLTPAIEEFCHCVRITIEHVNYARLLVGHTVVISTNRPEKAGAIADQIRSLLRLLGISVT